ncbi:hypothetical protein C8D93_101504 [Sinimarinibacterium flocculans]|uniref:Uncharacterized protein n=1 Tax=Sinimarinibacterium flocculans TaxID=985250 RepID=A0A318EF53_9GAMM|nr:hypothetical protein C8D93_101504 [Sinimarinibacterium flocculans]
MTPATSLSLSAAISRPLLKPMKPPGIANALMRASSTTKKVSSGARVALCAASFQPIVEM